jgi:hypothetical protein
MPGNTSTKSGKLCPSDWFVLGCSIQHFLFFNRVSDIMVNTKLIQYNLDSGDFETLFNGEKQHTKPEYVVKRHFEDKGYDVINVEPTTSRDKLPEKLKGLEKYFKPGVPDLFLYGMDNEENRFVEVKGSNDGVMFHQLKYIKESYIDCQIIFVQQNLDEYQCGQCDRIFDTEKGVGIHKAYCNGGEDPAPGREDGEKPIRLERFTRFGETGSS